MVLELATWIRIDYVDTCLMSIKAPSFAFVLEILVLASQVQADPQHPGVQTDDIAEVRNIILAQLNAFREDDAVQAFSYAAPEIRRKFKPPEAFLNMVRKSYQSVYRPLSFEFQPIRWTDGRVYEPLTVVGSSGTSGTALYVMERQLGGLWKIAGCTMSRETGEDT